MNENMTSFNHFFFTIKTNMYIKLFIFHLFRTKMQERSSHLQDKCSFYGLDDNLHKPNPWEFLINKKHHLVWCNVFKAASTSWMYNFNLLAGYSPQFLKKSNVVPLTLARKKYPRPSVLEVSKFIILNGNTRNILFMLSFSILEFIFLWNSGA